MGNPLDGKGLINETEIRIAVKKLKNNTYSFSDKIKNQMNKSPCHKWINASLSKII